MMMIINIFLLNVLILQIFPTINGRNVFIDVKSQNWHSYPVSFVSELSEFISEQSQLSYWNFIDRMCQHSDIIDSVINNSINNNDIDINGEHINIDSSNNLHDSIAELQTLSYEIATSILPKSLHAIMDTSIGLGTYLPTIKFYQTLSEPYGNPCNGSSYIVTFPSGEISCSTSSVSIHGNNNKQHPDLVTGAWEHNYENDKMNDLLIDKNELPHIILYGSIGSSSYCLLHNQLSQQYNNNLINYSSRHAYPGMIPISNEVRLQGYGVFLDIKNMEYKNVDDRKKSDSDDNIDTASKEEQVVAASFPENEEIMGIIFSKVYERYANYGGELTMLREQVIKKAAEEVGSGTEMKVWKMKDLGLQSLQSIILQSNKHVSSTISNSQLSIDRFTDIVHNFPKIAALLSSIKVDAKVRSDVQEYWSSKLPGTIPSNAIFINGMVVDLAGNTFNIYDLLNTIKEEVLKMNQLESLNLPVSLPPVLKNIASSMNNDVISSNPMLAQFGRIIRIDISKGGKHAVNFINNLEKDAAYKKWPKSLRVLNQPSWSLQTIAKNLYTLVVVIDPTTVLGASLFLQILMMWQQEYPVRFGFVLACPSDNTDICRLYKFLSVEYGSDEAHSFLSSVSTYLRENYDNVPQNDMYAHYMEEHEPIKELAVSKEVVINRDVILEIYASIMIEITSSITIDKLTTDAISLLATDQFVDYIKNSTLYIEARGLTINSYSMNGIINTNGDLSSIMQVLAREQYIITQLYQSKKINDRTKSLFSTILTEFNAYSRYHRMLDDSSKNHISVLSTVSINYLSNLHYYYPIDNDININNKFINTTIIIALPTYNGLKSIAAGFEFIKNDPTSKIAFSFNINQARCSMTVENNINCIQDMDVIQRIGLIHNIDDYNLNSNSMELIFEALSDKDVSISDIIALINQEINTANTSSLKGINGKGIRKLSTFSHTVESINKDVENDYIELDKIINYLIQKNVLSSSIFNINDNRANHVIYNTRKIHSYGDNAFHYLDYSLLATLEFNRYGERLLAAMNNHANEENSCKNEDFDDIKDPKLTTARGSNGAGIRKLDTEIINQSNNCESSLLSSIKLLILSSFCGVYNTDSSSKRFNIMNAINENDLTNSSLLFHVDPLHDVYIDKSISIEYIIDPLSLAGQRAASLISLIETNLHFKQLVILTPKIDISEFPLQNFYRFVISSHDQTQAIASFKFLPRQHTLTTRIDSPEAWNIQATSALQDIDNLICDSNVCGDIHKSKDNKLSMKDTTEITYTLKNLLVSGQCFQESTRSPPNGLQLILTPVSFLSNLTSDNERDTQVHSSGTLVMQNLGYYQLQANPGLYQLNLAKGKASDLFDIKNTNDEIGYIIVVNSFSDSVNRLIVEKKIGMEMINLLDDNTNKEDYSKKKSSSKEKSSFLSSLLGFNKDKETKEKKDISRKSVNDVSNINDSVINDDDKIHVFSLATGHMYERLLRIMMLSVSKRTSMPVKFWLLENYLSPKFKLTASVMAAEYGFEVAYVTYKWPTWLRQQTAKQRIIWGYKILFLDVLFPLHIKKVIYVDSDQVIRADLKELWDLDLHGKPYAYTPFCDTREETLGFQFWRKGYWNDHLAGLPYHISALYVVDLQNFRRNAVGDTLRSVYDNLSRDPNSLANLDQDLPNYAQHQVPIHSLPQEWLWCETWCSDKSKNQAKTIDLCNNPLHKEPKLDMARRVISGKLFNESWIELDEEIKSLEKKHGLVVFD